MKPKQHSSVTFAAILLAVFSLAATAAHADQVKIGGFWIPNVTISDIVEGRLLYSNDQGEEFDRALADIQAIALDANPALREAHEAIDAENHAAALPKLVAAAKLANVKWQRSWIAAQLVRTYDKLNQPELAVARYLDLLQMQADNYFLSNPPLASLQGAQGDLKQKLATQVNEALGKAKGDAARTALQQMQALLGEGSAEAVAEVQATIEASADLPGEAAVALPRSFVQEKDDPIARLIWAGKWDEALAESARQLQAPTRRMSFYLYLHALAQLQLADAAGDESGYKDAGLSFMRVAAFFPKSPWAVPSLLEAAYVHQKIGRPEIANRLLEEVGPGIDAESEPELAKRLEEIRAAGSDTAAP